METVQEDIIENGYYHTASGKVLFMTWYTEYGMEVFQPVPEREPVDTTGLESKSLEEALKTLVTVGDMKFTKKKDIHIQFDKPSA